MQKILKIVFSNRTSGLLLLLFAIAMAVATFIENDYGTETAKALVYSAKWFEMVMVLLAINFAGNIAKYNLFSWEKAPIFIFHVAFIIVIIGAGVTKYRGKEALLTIKEGQETSRSISLESFLQVQATNGKITQTFSSDPLLMSEIGYNSINENFAFEDQEIAVNLKKYIPRAQYNFKDTTNGRSYLHLVISENEERKDFFIEEGKRKVLFGVPIAFDAPNTSKEDIYITKKNEVWMTSFPEDTGYFIMAQNQTGTYVKDSLMPLQLRALSTYKETPIVFSEILENKTREIIQQEKNSDQTNPESAVVLTVSSGKESKDVTLFGGKGYMNPFTTLFLNGMHLNLRYGSKPVQLPFSMYLKDFILERYPGSESPSAFYSEIEVREETQAFDYTIFMNNVLNHKGYRFFQAAYLPDESGTILSVNQDYWGTLITYIGYGLLALGMLLSLVWKDSHFGFLLKALK